MKPKGYTIVELIIVITIILVLAGAAIGGTSGIIRNLRFTNTFNKMVLMVQQARSNAITGKNEQSYGINIQSSVFQIFAGTSTTVIETLQAPTNLVFSTKGSLTCAAAATIEFTSLKATTTLKCNGIDEKQLEVSLCNDSACTTNKKSFLINKAAGIPQVR